MLGIPGGAVLIEALFFLRAAVLRTLPCAGKQSKVRFGGDSVREGYLLAAHALAEGNRPASRSDLGYKCTSSPAEVSPRLKRMTVSSPAHAVEPDRGFDFAVHTQSF